MTGAELLRKLHAARPSLARGHNTGTERRQP
jgi:hypothetical protein